MIAFTMLWYRHQHLFPESASGNPPSASDGIGLGLGAQKMARHIVGELDEHL